MLGDSHAAVFKHWRFRVQWPRTRIITCIVGGATASGLENPNSKTQAGQSFERALKRDSPNVIVTLLGEVDTGFVIWYRARRYAQPVESMLSIAVTNYTELLRKCRQRAPTVVVSAPLPTIRDGQNWGEVANLRKEVVASQRERTELTLEFNRRVRASSHKLDCDFLALDRWSLGDDHVVASWLVNPDGCDHHYSIPRYAQLILKNLNPVLKRYGGGVQLHRASTDFEKPSLHA